MTTKTAMATATATAKAIATAKADSYGMTDKTAAAKRMALSRIEASGTDTPDFGYNYDHTCNYGDNNRDQACA